MSTIFLCPRWLPSRRRCVPAYGLPRQNGFWTFFVQIAKWGEAQFFASQAIVFPQANVTLLRQDKSILVS